MRYAQHCLAHYPGISSNMTNVADTRTPPTSLMLAQQPPYPGLHNTHITHAGASPTLARQPCKPR